MVSLPALVARLAAAILCVVVSLWLQIRRERSEQTPHWHACFDAYEAGDTAALSSEAVDECGMLVGTNAAYGLVQMAICATAAAQAWSAAAALLCGWLATLRTIAGRPAPAQLTRARPRGTPSTWSSVSPVIHWAAWLGFLWLYDLNWRDVSPLVLQAVRAWGRWYFDDATLAVPGASTVLAVLVVAATAYLAGRPWSLGARDQEGAYTGILGAASQAVGYVCVALTLFAGFHIGVVKSLQAQDDVARLPGYDMISVAASLCAAWTVGAAACHALPFQAVNRL